MTDTLKLTVKSNVTGEIVIKHNSRIVGSGGEAAIEVPAKKLGRGPVRLHAVVQHGDQEIYSAPLEVQIKGKILTDIPKPQPDPSK
jgi:hypothetical protein